MFGICDVPQAGIWGARDPYLEDQAEEGGGGVALSA